MLTTTIETLKQKENNSDIIQKEFQNGDVPKNARRL